MTETTDRQDAVPAAGPAPLAPDDREAIAAVEGARPHAEPAVADTAAATAVLVVEDDDDPASAADQPDHDAADTAGEYAGEAPLLDGELEEGIASIFAALHSAAAGGDDAEPDSHEAPEDRDDDFAAADVSTLRLLGELDRLWHRAA